MARTLAMSVYAPVAGNSSAAKVLFEKGVEVSDEQAALITSPHAFEDGTEPAPKKAAPKKAAAPDEG